MHFSHSRGNERLLRCPRLCESRPPIRSKPAHAVLLPQQIIVPVLPYRLESLGYTGVSAKTSWLTFAFSIGIFISEQPLRRSQLPWLVLAYTNVSYIPRRILFCQVPLSTGPTRRCGLYPRRIADTVHVGKAIRGSGSRQISDGMLKYRRMGRGLCASVSSLMESYCRHQP